MNIISQKYTKILQYSKFRNIQVQQSSDKVLNRRLINIDKFSYSR